ncbi:MAG: hypothetical protein AOA66_1265 [Candidatus Bathyarchaeota archaeon BA2]|nr:MAG: hypothetical protein AOA66_1265 [Candidatus Bathyarchaeota archaeon BA2]
MALEEQLVPIFGVIFGCGIAMLAIYLGITSEHKEKMKRLELIEKGLWKPEYDMKVPVAEKVLGGGFVLAAIGSAVLVGLQITELAKTVYLIGGLILLFLGIALIAYGIILKKGKR